jgi:hypothetical protein
MTRFEISVITDKPGRTVQVDHDDHGLVLEVGGVSGPIPTESEWTWLTADEAREIAHALLTAADEMDAAE